MPSNIPSAVKPKHKFYLQDAPNNSPPGEFDGTQSWDIHTGRPTTYKKDMVPFVVSQAKKKSEKVLARANKILENKII